MTETKEHTRQGTCSNAMFLPGPRPCRRSEAISTRGQTCQAWVHTVKSRKPSLHFKVWANATPDGPAPIIIISGSDITVQAAGQTGMTRDGLIWRRRREVLKHPPACFVMLILLIKRPRRESKSRRTLIVALCQNEGWWWVSTDFNSRGSAQSPSVDRDRNSSITDWC